ncbi:MAG: ribonuclease HII [Eubacteriaceae bacterium]|nr:ribonuclease HII [Eubacteriaceae bacterium]
MARMTKAEREIYLKEHLIEMKYYENQLRDQGFHYIAGVDEVGRGPLAGPVVTAAVILPEDFDLLGVDDSKKLTEKKREELYGKILEKAVGYGIGIKDNRVIDEINILEATRLAMTEAIVNADRMLKERVGADIDFVLFDAMKIDDVNKPQMSLIKGDSKSVSIAAASIIAKVTRDRMMVEYHKTYPYYGFESNKGYGTAAHYEGLKSHGITPIHRVSFLKNFNNK